MTKRFRPLDQRTTDAHRKGWRLTPSIFSARPIWCAANDPVVQFKSRVSRFETAEIVN